MADNNPLDDAKTGISIVSEIIKAAGDDTQVKEAAGNLGKTAVTLTKTINNALMPLAAINFAFDKAREYFSSKFQEDITKKVDSIPPEDLVEPKASIAGPALQGLAFSHEEKNLKDMFLNLLATSMDGRKADTAHPAFVEIIKQLNSEDARLVSITLRSSSPVPIVEIHGIGTDGRGRYIRARHILDYNDHNGQPFEDKALPAMVDNWIRLGLVTVDYDKHLTNSESYKWVEGRPEYIREKQMLENENKKIDYTKGIMFRTELGKQFAAAVGVE